MTAIHSFVQDLRSRISGIQADCDIFAVPTEASEWSVLAHKLPSEPRLWLHIGLHNKICYALRMGLSSHQNPLIQQWFNGSNAIRHLLSNTDSPSTALIHSRANEVDFYRQALALFTEHSLILLKTNSNQQAVMTDISAQVHRYTRPFFSRAHPRDGAALFGAEAFSTRLVADVILDRERVTIASLLPHENEAQTPPSSKITAQAQTPPNILFSAFVLSLRRIEKDDAQWEDDAFVGQIQGHDPHGSVLILGSGSKRSLVQKWLQIVSRMPKQSPWHYELDATGQRNHLYLPKMIRSAFGPHVAVLESKNKPEHYRILDLHLFCPSKS